MTRERNHPRFAVITGSSNGIGRQIALTLARSGVDVLIHGGHDLDAIQNTVNDAKLCGAKATGVCIDLSEKAGQKKFFDAATQQGFVPDIWINNAGADILTGANADENFEKKLELLWNVDVLATIRLSKWIGQMMVRNQSGVIINMSWDQVETGMEGDAGELFGTTKGAVTAFTRSLAKTLAPTVRVNGIAPGWIKTKWGESAPDRWKKRAIGESLLGRWGSADEIAMAAEFLVSEKAEFITGQIIAVNGGRR